MFKSECSDFVYILDKGEARYAQDNVEKPVSQICSIASNMGHKIYKPVNFFFFSSSSGLAGPELKKKIV